MAAPICYTSLGRGGGNMEVVYMAGIFIGLSGMVYEDLEQGAPLSAVIFILSFALFLHPYLYP